MKHLIPKDIPLNMKLKESESEAPLSFWPFVRMTAPVFLFGVILPFTDIVTDLRLILRLYIGVTGCGGDGDTGWQCWSSHVSTYCQEHPEECKTVKHPIFETLLLGKKIF